MNSVGQKQYIFLYLVITHLTTWPQVIMLRWICMNYSERCMMLCHCAMVLCKPITYRIVWEAKCGTAQCELLLHTSRLQCLTNQICFCDMSDLTDASLTFWLWPVEWGDWWESSLMSCAHLSVPLFIITMINKSSYQGGSAKVAGCTRDTQLMCSEWTMMLFGIIKPKQTVN